MMHAWMVKSMSWAKMTLISEEIKSVALSYAWLEVSVSQFKSSFGLGKKAQTSMILTV